MIQIHTWTLFISLSFMSFSGTRSASTVKKLYGVHLPADIEQQMRAAAVADDDNDDAKKRSSEDEDNQSSTGNDDSGKH